VTATCIRRLRCLESALGVSHAVCIAGFGSTFLPSARMVRASVQGVLESARYLRPLGQARGTSSLVGLSHGVLVRVAQDERVT
jgi:hypothetical protein